MRRIAKSSLFPSDESPKGGAGAVTEAGFRTQRQVVAASHAMSGDPKIESLYRVWVKVYIGFRVKSI